VESGSATLASEEEPDEVPAARPAPRIDPVDTPLDPDAEAQVGVGSWQQGYDASFAEESRLDDPAEPTQLVPGVAAEEPGLSLATTVAFAVVVGGIGGMHRAEREPRRQFRR